MFWEGGDVQSGSTGIVAGGVVVGAGGGESSASGSGSELPGIPDMKVQLALSIRDAIRGRQINRYFMFALFIAVFIVALYV